jgi:superfamily I DNA and/or RNA helicase
VPEYETELRALLESQAATGLKLLDQTVLKKLRQMNSTVVQRFADYLPITVWKDHEVDDLDRAARSFLTDFYAISITNLSVKNAFPLREQLFDLLVIDEASQCDTASALPMMFRAKRAVIIGDPLQLKHITSVKPYEDRFVAEALDLSSLQLSYVQKSLYDYAFDLSVKSNLETVFLSDHYRCHPEIVRFANDHFYEAKLGQSMSIRTVESHFKLGRPGMNWINVQGQIGQLKNINTAEVRKCIDLSVALFAKYSEASIGIITPFRDQKIAIQDALPAEIKERVKVDTVHRFQGDEMDIIIFSTVVTQDAPSSKASFINHNAYLINVAITRARSSLYIVGNHKYCANLKDGTIKSPLSQLAFYATTLGKVTDN